MYEIMFYGGTVLTGVFFIASVVLFVRNKVWKLLGDLTGWNARNAIKKLDKKGAEDTSKTEAIKQDVSKVLVHKATTTGSLQEMPDQTEDETSIPPEKEKKIRKNRSKKGEKAALLQQKEPETDGIFEVEEDMMVLAGSKNKNLLQEGDDSETALPEADGDDSETTLLVAEGDDSETTLLVAEGDDSETTLPVAEGDDSETTLLVAEGDDSETTLLVGEGDDSETTLLAGEGDDSETTLLAAEGDDSETTLLVAEGDNSATTLLVAGEDDSATTLLASEARMPKFEPVLQEDEELMALLQGTPGRDR